MMTTDELKQHYGVVYRTLMQERNMRSRVFHSQPAKLATKLAEIDRALAALAAIKNALKPTLDDAPQQGTLFDVPTRKSY